jgi:hypothetical protein
MHPSFLICKYIVYTLNMAKDKKKDEKKASKKGPGGALIFLGAIALLGGVFALLVFLEVFILRKKPEFDPDTDPPLSAAACGSYSYTPVIKGGLKNKLSFSMTTSPSASWLSVDSDTGVVSSSNVPFDAQNTTVTLKVTEDSKREENTATQIFTISITRKSADATWDPDTKSAGITIEDNLVTAGWNTTDDWAYADLVPQKGCRIDFDWSGMDTERATQTNFFGIYATREQGVDSRVDTTDGSLGFEVAFDRFAQGFIRMDLRGRPERVESEVGGNAQTRIDFIKDPISIWIVDSKVVKVQLPGELVTLDPPLDLDDSTDYYIGVRKAPFTNANGGTIPTAVDLQVSYEYCD